MGLGLGKKRKEVKAATRGKGVLDQMLDVLSCLVMILSSLALRRFVLSCLVCLCLYWCLSSVLVLVLCWCLSCDGACLVLILRLLKGSTIAVRKLHHLRHISNDMMQVP
jgi:hypothetical protein